MHNVHLCRIIVKRVMLCVQKKIDRFFFTNAHLAIKHWQMGENVIQVLPAQHL